MNALAQRIAGLVAQQGPISIAQFMMIAMHDRADGYYATRETIGAGGDFVTAPEISQQLQLFEPTLICASTTYR